MEHTTSLLLQDEPRSEKHALEVSSRIVSMGPSAADNAGHVPTSKVVVLNDVTNTGVMAALIGGFALSCLQSTDFRLNEDEYSTVDEIIYLLLVFAVHACTCSALTSALLYREANLKEDGATIARWATKYKILLICR